VRQPEAPISSRCRRRAGSHHLRAIALVRTPVPCVGDCGGPATVAINDLITLVHRCYRGGDHPGREQRADRMRRLSPRTAKIQERIAARSTHSPGRRSLNVRARGQRASRCALRAPPGSSPRCSHTQRPTHRIEAWPGAAARAPTPRGEGFV
jgi:hypothetical protein